MGPFSKSDSASDLAELRSIYEELKTIVDEEALLAYRKVEANGRLRDLIERCAREPAKLAFLNQLFGPRTRL